MTVNDLSRRSIARTILCTPILTCLWLGTASTAHAETVIRHPGQHTHYSFELEPHLAMDWDDPHWSGNGIGPGVHFAIPIMHQGPIDTINNNMAIKFGMDLTFGGGCYYYRNYAYYNDYCSTTSLTIPIALQWNFYVTDIIVPFGEVGMAIRNTWWSYDGACVDTRNCPSNHHSDLYPIFYPAVGAKFMFGRSAGLTVRMGYPHITLGASILF